MTEHDEEKPTVCDCGQEHPIGATLLMSDARIVQRLNVGVAEDEDVSFLFLEVIATDRGAEVKAHIDAGGVESPYDPRLATTETFLMKPDQFLDIVATAVRGFGAGFLAAVLDRAEVSHLMVPIDEEGGSSD